MKKQNKTSQKEIRKTRKTELAWKNKREIISKSIPLEVDLENREIFFKTDIRKTLNFEFDTTNIDRLISTYLDPNDSQKVTQSLTKAKEGLEKPILFNFIHPHTSRSFQFEYRYQIIYVKYSSTRLQGELINVSDPKVRRKIRQENNEL
jgi:hypothetical protein